MKIHHRARFSIMPLFGLFLPKNGKKLQKIKKIWKIQKNIQKNCQKNCQKWLKMKKIGKIQTVWWIFLKFGM